MFSFLRTCKYSWILSYQKYLSQQKALSIFGFREMHSNPGVNHNEIDMTTHELIHFHGYRAETHHVWTEDGYRLDVHRVLPSSQEQQVSLDKSIDLTDIRVTEVTERLQNTCTISGAPKDGVELIKPATKPVVLIYHGLLSSSADWVLLGPKKALAYLLCDQGYDVWLGNARGNRYSQCHKQYQTKDKEFWNFSWHEIGIHDLPATIDYILEKTGNSDMYYIGYSQGTTVFFVMASERSEYNAKIRGMCCLAPIAFLSNQRSPLLKCVVPLHILMKWASAYCNINEWFPRNKLQSFALATLMSKAPEPFARTFCNCWFYLVAGFGSDQLDKAMLPIIFGHFPAGASAKQIIHYSQAIQSGRFQQFDYGPMDNTKIYGTKEPPTYDFTKVKIPVAIFYSDNDFLNHPSDVDSLFKALPNVTEKCKINYAKFNHIDYLWGRDAKTLVYDDIIKMLKRF